MRIFIAEKPSVGKAIAEQLGIVRREKSYITCQNGDVITWCFGHMLELSEPDEYLPNDIPLTKKGTKRWREQDLPILPNKWRLNPKKEATEQLKAIGKLLKQAQSVINAGDPDREGQLLVDEVIAHFGFKGNVLRFWASAMDKTSITKALNNLKDNIDYQGLGLAASARSKADWLIGMNLTRAYTLSANKTGNVGVISVGRVQTPTLNLICMRDNEINNFKPHNFYRIYADLIHVNGNFRALHKPQNKQEIIINQNNQTNSEKVITTSKNKNASEINNLSNSLDVEGRIINKELAEQIIADIQTNVINNMLIITSYQTLAKSQKQPLPFSLADITREANSKYGFTADEVLKICQSLYETHKLTSYPRTDCRYLPLSMHTEIANVLKAVRTNLHKLISEQDIKAQSLVSLINKANPQIKSHAFNDKKVTAHHGIIPTAHIGNLSELTANEIKVYELIVKRYLAQSFPEYKYLETKVLVNIAGEEFTAYGQTPQDLGFKVIYQAKETEEREVQDNEEIQKDSENTQDENTTTNANIPAMQEGGNLKLADLAYLTLQTKPPQSFTEGTLIWAMENIHRFITNQNDKDLLKEGDGIGTPATRAHIITDLKKRGFVEVKGKKLISTDLGKSFLNSLKDELILSPTLTAQFERTLKEIAQIGINVNEAQNLLTEFLDTQTNFVIEQVRKINNQTLNLDGLPTNKTNKINKSYSNVKNNKQSNTNNSAGTKNDKSVTNKLPISELHKCTSCGAGLIRRPSKFKGFWWACSSYPTCKTTYFDKNGKPNYESKKSN